MEFPLPDPVPPHTTMTLSMIAPIDIPQSLEDLIEETRKRAAELFEALASHGKEDKILSGTDLLQSTPAYYYIRQGFIKYFHHAKLVRFFSGRDFLLLDRKEDLVSSRLMSEFASEVIIFKRDSFLKALEEKPEFRDKWLTLTEMESHVSLLLSSLYLWEDIVPAMNVKSYLVGDVIIKQGDEPDAIYFMLSGSAVASVDGKEVGTIGPNEVFGELSFLTAQTRTATVKAKNNCIVQSVGREDFLKMIQTKPALAESMLKTMAARLVKLTDKVTAK